MSMTMNMYNQLMPIEKWIDVDPYNRRIKIYQLPHKNNLEATFNALQQLGKEKQCDKLIFYVNPEEMHPLLEKWCTHEGTIKGFFQGEDAHIYSLFLDQHRNEPIDWKKEQNVLSKVKSDQKILDHISLPQGYTMRRPSEKDTPRMAALYQAVFKTYPTPMNDPHFIIAMMHENVYFTIVEFDRQIVSACSADLFPAYNCAEMADCATTPEQRKQGLLSHQFMYLIKLMRQKNVQTLFSYSRSVSFGMNLINIRTGFTYGGVLRQNSNISGRLECMNIWYKNL